MLFFFLLKTNGSQKKLFTVEAHPHLLPETELFLIFFFHNRGPCLLIGIQHYYQCHFAATSPMIFHRNTMETTIPWGEEVVFFPWFFAEIHWNLHLLSFNKSLFFLLFSHFYPFLSISIHFYPFLPFQNGGVLKWRYPLNGWFIVEDPNLKWRIGGYPYDSGNYQTDISMFVQKSLGQVDLETSLRISAPPGAGADFSAALGCLKFK